MKAIKKPKTVSFEELEDKYFGKKGTTKRTKYETELTEEIIGELLKQAREKQNLTQAQLAKKLGINKSNISKMENNIKSLRMDTFLKVLKALHAKLTVSIEFDKADKEVKLT
jgi:HTH-type transcriptional regulator / antitoxin HipB